MCSASALFLGYTMRVAWVIGNCPFPPTHSLSSGITKGFSFLSPAADAGIAAKRLKLIAARMVMIVFFIMIYKV